MSPTALVFEERQYTLPQLEALADGLATSLRERGVTAGDRVALMSSNRPEFIVALHAIWRLAAVVVLISPAWKRHEVTHALAVTNPSHAVGDHDVLSDLMPMLHLDDPILEGSRVSRRRLTPMRCWHSARAPPGCRKPFGTAIIRCVSRWGTGATRWA
jgi:long-chain acyl-CoA synthetase